MSNNATNHTVAFVQEYLPKTDIKILEVGCGHGEVAAALTQLGYQVTAIDLLPENIERAKALGVDAHVGDIMTFGAENTYDAVLFTRSLHHIHPLDTALARVKTLLNEMGKILVEDFAIEQMDMKTANWFYETKDLVSTLAGIEEPVVDESIRPIDSLDRWKREHRHEPALHTRKEMQRVMERDFGNIRSSMVPYLYRYFSELTSKFPGHDRATDEIFKLESKLIERGQIQSIGLRIVAKRYFSYFK